MNNHLFNEILFNKILNFFKDDPNFTLVDHDKKIGLIISVMKSNNMVIGVEVREIGYKVSFQVFSYGDGESLDKEDAKEIISLRNTLNESERMQIAFINNSFSLSLQISSREISFFSFLDDLIFGIKEVEIFEYMLQKGLTHEYIDAVFENIVKI